MARELAHKDHKKIIINIKTLEIGILISTFKPSPLQSMMAMIFSEASGHWSRVKKNVKQMSSWVCKHSRNLTTASMFRSKNQNQTKISSDSMMYWQPRRLEIPTVNPFYWLC